MNDPSHLNAPSVIKGVLLDLSGVLHVGETALSGAADALDRLRGSGLPLRFVTNTTRSTRQAVAARLQRLGFAVGEAEIMTAPRAARDYVVRHGLRPLLIVHPGVAAEFADLVQERPNAVLLGDGGEAFDYRHLNAAFRLIMDGAPLLAMGRNRYFMDDDGLNLDAGPFVAALEYATGTTATVLGKPAAEFYAAAVAELGCAAGEAVMVGDDVEGDVLGAAAAGLQGVLVRSGKYRAGDERRLDGRTTRVLDDLAAVVDWILRDA